MLQKRPAALDRRFVDPRCIGNPWRNILFRRNRHLGNIVPTSKLTQTLNVSSCPFIARSHVQSPFCSCVRGFATSSNTPLGAFPGIPLRLTRFPRSPSLPRYRRHRPPREVPRPPQRCKHRVKSRTTPSPTAQAKGAPKPRCRILKGSPGEAPVTTHRTDLSAGNPRGGSGGGQPPVSHFPLVCPRPATCPFADPIQSKFAQ